jgi:hypothetical protein
MVLAYHNTRAYGHGRHFITHMHLNNGLFSSIIFSSAGKADAGNENAAEMPRKPSKAINN